MTTPCASSSCQRLCRLTSDKLDSTERESGVQSDCAPSNGVGPHPDAPWLTPLSIVDRSAPSGREGCPRVRNWQLYWHGAKSRGTDAAQGFDRRANARPARTICPLAKRDARIRIGGTGLLNASRARHDSNNQPKQTHATHNACIFHWLDAACRVLCYSQTGSCPPSNRVDHLSRPGVPHLDRACRNGDRLHSAMGHN